MKARRGLGLVEVGNGTNGGTLYIAEEGDDTSGLYMVGVDNFGNQLYSDSPNTSVDSQTLDSISGILGTVASIYQKSTAADLKAQQIKTATPRPLGSTLTTQQILLYGALALGAYMLLSKR